MDDIDAHCVYLWCDRQFIAAGLFDNFGVAMAMAGSAWRSWLEEKCVDDLVEGALPGLQAVLFREPWPLAGLHQAPELDFLITERVFLANITWDQYREVMLRGFGEFGLVLRWFGLTPIQRFFGWALLLELTVSFLTTDHVSAISLMNFVQFFGFGFSLGIQLIALSDAGKALVDLLAQRFYEVAGIAIATAIDWRLLFHALRQFGWRVVAAAVLIDLAVLTGVLFEHHLLVSLVRIGISYCFVASQMSSRGVFQTGVRSIIQGLRRKYGRRWPVVIVRRALRRLGLRRLRTAAGFRLDSGGHVPIRAATTADVQRCSRCLDEFFDGEPVAEPACGHLLHTGCAEAAFRHKSRCPVCRAWL
jgi:hypothetical protein